MIGTILKYMKFELNLQFFLILHILFIYLFIYLSICLFILFFCSGKMTTTTTTTTFCSVIDARIGECFTEIPMSQHIFHQ